MREASFYELIVGVHIVGELDLNHRAPNQTAMLTGGGGDAVLADRRIEAAFWRHTSAADVR